MARESSPEMDDELFKDIYGKKYTPPVSAANKAAVSANKRPSKHDDSEEENKLEDPNAVPTDFTSREAKVWEAKSKAIERNWKKRKEEEMICKICGESGHFTQGCPSTLGGNRKSADFFERVAARDKHVRSLFSGRVISQIEKDVGCKIKMDEKFIIVSGKDRLIVAKGVDAVHKIIQGSKDKTDGSTSSHRSRSRSPGKSPAGSSQRRSESQRSDPSPRNTSRTQNSNFSQGKAGEYSAREGARNLSRVPPQARAFDNDGAKGHSARAKSPQRSHFDGNSRNSYGRNDPAGLHKADGWNIERRSTDFLSEQKMDFPVFPQTLEDLEAEFKKETIDLARIRDQEEDEENNKHREFIREFKDTYMQKLAITRGMHAKEWEDFLHIDMQRRQLALARHSSYSRPGFPDYEHPSLNAQYMSSGVHMDPSSRFPYRGENYSSSRPHDAYGEFPNERNDNLGRAYRRY